MRYAAILIVLAVAACGGEKSPLENARTDYLRACAMCHGADGRGLGNLGNSLHDNEFVRARGDDELVAFLKKGRAPSDPDNRSGMPMPPKGGDPRLTDEDLRQIVLYLRAWTPKAP